MNIAWQTVINCTPYKYHLSHDDYNFIESYWVEMWKMKYWMPRINKNQAITLYLFAVRVTSWFTEECQQKLRWDEFVGCCLLYHLDVHSSFPLYQVYISLLVCLFCVALIIYCFLKSSSFFFFFVIWTHKQSSGCYCLNIK